MSKFKVFLGLYTVVMIVLFCTFCYLMSTINPPQVAPEFQKSKRFGTDDMIYSNELIDSDNLGYGLEKVYDNYDSIDDLTGLNIERKITTIGKPFSTKSTSGIIIKMATKSMKHVKGLRRSINKENQQNDTIPRTVHLKIKNLDGKARIEIKVVPEKTKKIRKYRSSTNNTSNGIKFYIDNNITNNVKDNISDEVIVIIENNEKLVLDFDRDSGCLPEANTSDVNVNEDDKTKIYLDLFNSTFGKNEINLITDIGNTTEYNPIVQSTQNDDQINITMKSVTFIEKTNTEFIRKSSEDTNFTSDLYSQSDNVETEQIDTGIGKSANTLVGLLIPEATATLPFNYHFIN